VSRSDDHRSPASRTSEHDQEKTEGEPVLVGVAGADGSAPVVIEPDLHVHMLPLDIEVHQVLSSFTIG